MYSNEDIQAMIEKCYTEVRFGKRVLDGINNRRDWAAAQNVISSRCFETFDRYDSDVCEQFIKAYESAEEKEMVEEILALPHEEIKKLRKYIDTLK